ncbi:MAG: hypothetical protein KAJ48_00620, partial [Elusimicrobiales bacterium]|nr:hypothetical protein [Elusimicrobiales bacterium]
IMVKARGSFNAYWKGTYLNTFSDWDTGAAKFTHWSTATYSNGEWSIDLPSLAPVNNSKISVWVRAIDKAGNWMATPDGTLHLDNNLNADSSAAHYFTFDNSIPLTDVTVPDTYALANSTGLLKGTAIEIGNEPSEVSEIKIRLRKSDGDYWNFFTDIWEAVDDYYDVSTFADPQWTRIIKAGSQEDGYQYSINHYAKDYSLNNFDGASFSTFTFIVDMTTPTSKVTFPVHNSFLGAVAAITGTADDSVENIINDWPSDDWPIDRNFEAGISDVPAEKGVEIAIQELTTDLWWDGSDFTLGAREPNGWHGVIFTGASSGTWTYNLPPGAIADGTTYYAMSRTRDIVSNIQTQYTTNYFTGDTSPPIGVST